MSKKITWVVVVIVLLGGLAYPKLFPGGFAAKDPDAGGMASKESLPPVGKSRGDRLPDNALQVSVFEVEPIEFIETISSSGTVRADESVELQAETDGKIISINFQEGTPVKKGDLLVKLNDSDLQANLERYKYARELSQLRFRRISELMMQKVVSQDEYDTALNEVKVQESFIELYRAEIRKTEIRAPFDGVVGLRFVSVGAYVSASTQIATLQRLNELKIDFSVPERYSGRLAVGGKIHFTVAGSLNRYEGEIYAIDPRIDAGTRTLLVRAVYPNEEKGVLPGAFTNVTVELEKYSNAVLIPSEAVIPSVDNKVVYGMHNGIAEMRTVETGMRTSTHVHILSGLEAGDLVIISGLQQIRDGLPVQELPKQEFPRETRDTATPGDVPNPPDAKETESDFNKSVSANPTWSFTLLRQTLT